MLILDKPWTRQPQVPVSVNGGNTSSRGIVDVLLPSVGASLLGRLPFTLRANGKLELSDNGVSVRGNGSANVASFAANLSAYTEITVTALINVDSWLTSTGFQMLWELTADGASNAGGFAIYNDGAATRKLTVVSRGTSAACTRYQGSGGTRPAFGQYVIVMSRHRIGGASAADCSSLVVDGVEQDLTTGAATSGGTFANSTLHVLSRNAATLPTAASIAVMVVHGRWIDNAEAATLRAPRDLWAMLAPRRIYIPTAAAAGDTQADLAATGATGTFSGTAQSECSAALAATGATGAFSATASSPATATLAATGSTGAFSGTAQAESTATLAATGGTATFSATANSTTTATAAIAGATGTFSGTASVASDYTRPSSDVAVTGWTASSGSDLYAMLDESAADDADYIQSPALGGGDPAIFGLTQSLAAGTWTMRVRADRTADGGQIRVSLLDGSNTQQGVSGWQALTVSWATYDLSVTTTGAATRARFEVQA